MINNRSKLFASITFLLIFFIFLLCVLNNIYLEQYYINNKKDILIENAYKLTNAYNGDAFEIQDELDRIANITGTSIDIRDKDGRLVFKSSRRLPNEKNLLDEDKLKPYLYRSFCICMVLFYNNYKIILQYLVFINRSL